MNITNSFGTILTFYDLNAWKESRRLAVLIYETTKKFPADEVFGITSQMRRAVISTTSNIAEGFSRQTYKDKVRFYSIALGSLTEIQSQILISCDLGFVDEQMKNALIDQATNAYVQLYGLIRKSKEIIRTS